MNRLGRWRRALFVTWTGGLVFSLLGVPWLLSTWWSLKTGAAPPSWPAVAVAGLLPISMACGARMRDPWMGAGVAATAAGIGCWLVWEPALMVFLLPPSAFTTDLSWGVDVPDRLAVVIEALVPGHLIQFWVSLVVAAVAGAIGGLWTRDDQEARRRPAALVWATLVPFRVSAALFIAMVAVDMLGTNLVEQGVDGYFFEFLRFDFWVTPWLAIAIATAAALHWLRCRYYLVGLLQLFVVFGGLVPVWLMLSLFVFGVYPVGMSWIPAGFAAGLVVAGLRRPSMAAGPMPGDVLGEAVWAGTVSVPLVMGTALVALMPLLGRIQGPIIASLPLPLSDVLPGFLMSVWACGGALLAVDALVVGAATAWLARTTAPAGADTHVPKSGASMQETPPSSTPDGGR